MAETETETKPTTIERMIVCNPDGSYTRLIEIPSTPATSTSKVLTKDIPINPNKQTWLRIYLPLLDPNSSSFKKLPLIVYYHGGGFVFMSAASTVNHDFCFLMAEKINALVISVDYRLAPEHRLPAAYEDAIEALHCLIRNSHEEEWIKNFADLSSCFLMGTSAGGNIAYHAGLLACKQLQDLYPLKIRGLMLHHPYFGGSQRTGSELKMVNDPVLPLSGNDFMWELSLPVGADRDHEYCNPISGFTVWELVRQAGFRILVAGGYGDPLIDRQVELAKMLQDNGVDTVPCFGESCHSLELTDLPKAEPLFLLLKDFMSCLN